MLFSVEKSPPSPTVVASAGVVVVSASISDSTGIAAYRHLLLDCEYLFIAYGMLLFSCALFERVIQITVVLHQDVVDVVVIRVLFRFAVCGGCIGFRCVGGFCGSALFQ